MTATIDSILTKVRRYNPQADADLLRRAHAYATEKHAGQTRRTGEPYIQHPVEVVNILADLYMDTPSLAAGFLHDVIEDCGVSREQLAADFGDEIAGLVDAVTKLKLVDFERRDPEAAEAARVAGCSTSTMHVRLFRGRRRIQSDSTAKAPARPLTSPVATPRSAP